MPSQAGKPIMQGAEAAEGAEAPLHTFFIPAAAPLHIESYLPALTWLLQRRLDPTFLFSREVASLFVTRLMLKTPTADER